MDEKFTKLDDFGTLKDINKKNKKSAIIGVLVALILSWCLIVIGVFCYPPKTPQKQIRKELVTKHNECIKQYSQIVCCRSQQKGDNVPVMITEVHYDAAPRALFYCCVLVFMALSLWGTFAALLKVLKSENDVNIKTIDMMSRLYEECQMWKLTKEKKEYELNSKEKELDYKIRKFNELEKVQKEFDASL